MFHEFSYVSAVSTFAIVLAPVLVPCGLIQTDRWIPSVAVVHAQLNILLTVIGTSLFTGFNLDIFKTQSIYVQFMVH